MNTGSVPKATLGRLPVYLKYLKSVQSEHKTISATVIAHALALGDVQVRKDLAAVSGTGRPKIGYDTKVLIEQLENCLGRKNRSQAIIVGAGKLGLALLDFDGFADYGIEIAAAFDTKTDTVVTSESGNPIFPIDALEGFCRRNKIRIGIIAVPVESAQSVCDRMIKSSIAAIMNFAPVELSVPQGVCLVHENLALSLAHLNSQIN